MRRHSAHVDADVLAELNAGLISGRRATRISAHLAGCQQCARRNAGLAEISTLLASVPSPAMPETVVRRLNATLVQEAAERSTRLATLARSGGQRGSDSVLRFRNGAAKSRRRGLTSPVGPVAARAFAAAAAVCVVAAGGYTLVRLTASGAGPSAPSHASAGGPVSGSPSRGPHAMPFLPQTPSTGANGSNLLPFKVIESGIDYRAATLSPQIKAELSPATSHGSRVLHTPTAQQYACVMDVTSDSEPALVDSARYQGQPAMIIALSHVGEQISQAWVVGPACSAENTDILAHVTLPTSGG